MIKSLIDSESFPTSFPSCKPNQTFAQYTFPFPLIISTSSAVNVDIEMDLIRCGGVIPLLQVYHKYKKLKNKLAQIKM